MWMVNQFHQWVKHEVVPAIRMDCGGADVPIWTAGASIGAFHAAAVVCRETAVMAGRQRPLWACSQHGPARRPLIRQVVTLAPSTS